LQTIALVESERRLDQQRSTKAKRLKAGWDNDYLLKVLQT